VSLEGFFGNEFDEYYYSVAVQAGYLTFEEYSSEEKTLPRKYRLLVPNEELRYVWRAYILSKIVNDPKNQLERIFAGIGDLERFSEDLGEFISFKLSCFDLEKKVVEKIYHVFIFGMLLTLGYECRSNREAGYGRYDLLVKAPEWTGVIEFKAAKTEEGLAGAAREGLKQIVERKHLNKDLEGGGPRGPIPKGATAKEVMARKMKAERGKAIYKKRCKRSLRKRRWSRSLGL
jgi:hypothetical protein